MPLFLQLPEFQINGDHQKPNQPDAHRQTDLTVFVLFMRLINERVSALNGVFTGC